MLLISKIYRKLSIYLFFSPPDLGTHTVLQYFGLSCSLEQYLPDVTSNCSMFQRKMRTEGPEPLRKLLGIILNTW